MTATHSTVVNFSSTNGTVCYLAIKTLSYNRVHRFSGGVAQLLRDLTIKKEEESTLIKTKKQKSTIRHGTGIKLGTLPKDAVTRAVLVRKSNFGFEMREQFIIPSAIGKQCQVLCDCCCKTVCL